MKNKFPGLRKPFYSAYHDLFERKFFGIDENYDLRDLPLIDRINLHFKIGMILNVPFSTEESEYVAAVGKAETWNEVRELAEKIYKYAKEKETELPLLSMLGDIRKIKDADDTEESDFDIDIDDSEDSSLEDYEDDSEEKKSSIDVKSEENSDEPFSITDKFFREKETEFLSEESQETLHLNLPRLNMRGRIIDYKTVHANMIFRNISDPEKEKIGNDLLRKFKTKNEKYIAYLIKEFTLRKNAKVLARAAVSKTGELDMKKLHTYRLADDIFKRVTIVPKGQNHGMVMFIDCSGSMQDNMQSTIEQTLILTSFCRKVNIPFQVFGFKNGLDKVKELSNNETLQKPEINDWVIDDNLFRLREYLSSRMSSREYINAQKNLLCLGIAFSQLRYRHYELHISIPISEALHSTPLNPAIIASIDIVNEFKQKNKLDIVNTIFLTDGDSDVKKFYSCGEGLSKSFDVRKTNLVLTDKRTKLQGRSSNGQPATVAVLDLMKKLTGTRLLGFFLIENFGKTKLKRQCADYAGRNKFISENEFTQGSVKKFFELKNCGYDSYYLLPGGKRLGNEEETLQIKSDDSKSIIKSAFRKSLQKKNINRMFLNRFMEHIS
jgi:hypothetical protein